MNLCGAAAGIKERSGRGVAEKALAILGIAQRYGGTGDGAEDGIRSDGIYAVQARSFIIHPTHHPTSLPQAFPKPLLGMLPD